VTRMPFLQTHDLIREYNMGESMVRALDGVSLSIDRGELVAILGVSGSGKSTLLHLLGALDTPTSGKVLIDGRDLASFRSGERTMYRRTMIGLIFQAYYLVPRMTAEENVAVALTFQGTFGRERRRRAVDAIERLGLASRAKHRPGQLSGGEQQRVAIARAIVHRPPLLLADEPTGNLDHATAADVVTRLNEIRRELGTTVVMVTHDHEIAGNVADRVLHLRDGRLIAEEDDPA
jgi:putative ABC transport system ATP-binding protein